MTESPAPPPPPTSSTATKIPQEIISGEGMALIDAAFASAAQSHRNPSCIQSRTPKRTATVSSPDIEDSGRVDWDSSPLKKRNIGPDSFLHRFRQKRSLFVTDITATVKIEYFPFYYFACFCKNEV